MKIGPFDPKAPAGPVGGERQAAPVQQQRSGPSAPKTVEASTQVELSDVAPLLDDGDNATFDAQKVERIAQAIRDGKYRVDAEAIADKLIANAQELLSRNRH